MRSGAQEKFNASTPPIGTTPQLQCEVLKHLEGLQGMASVRRRLDILSKPDHKQKLITAGFEVTAKDAKGHGERIAREIPLFKKVIADAGIEQF